MNFWNIIPTKPRQIKIFSFGKRYFVEPTSRTPREESYLWRYSLCIVISINLVSELRQQPVLLEGLRRGPGRLASILAMVLLRLDDQEELMIVVRQELGLQEVEELVARPQALGLAQLGVQIVVAAVDPAQGQPVAHPEGQRHIVAEGHLGRDIEDEAEYVVQVEAVGIATPVEPHGLAAALVEGVHDHIHVVVAPSDPGAVRVQPGAWGQGVAVVVQVRLGEHIRPLEEIVQSVEAAQMARLPFVVDHPAAPGVLLSLSALLRTDVIPLRLSSGFLPTTARSRFHIRSQATPNVFDKSTKLKYLVGN